MKTESSFPNDKEMIKKEMLATVELIQILQEQNINLFDRPQVYQRAHDLITVLEEKSKELTQFFHDPSPEEEKNLQDLIFNLKKMKDVILDLKENPREIKFQQAFIKSKEHIHSSLQHL